jgi:hypothetical protein
MNDVIYIGYIYNNNNNINININILFMVFSTGSIIIM